MMRAPTVVNTPLCDAWLWRDDAVPAVSIQLGWPTGARFDPLGQEGAAALSAALLTEGAGDLDATAFADALADKAIELQFWAEPDWFGVSLRCLANVLPDAIHLVNLALTAPRFQEDAVSRVRARMVAAARRERENPRRIALRTFLDAYAPGQRIVRRSQGTEDGLANAQISKPEPLGEVLAVAAGAISPEQLTEALGALGLRPWTSGYFDPPMLRRVVNFGEARAEMAVPQSAICFGGARMLGSDDAAAQIALQIMANGDFGSRLMEAVREKGGLAYGIGAGLARFDGVEVLVGSTATENARVPDVMALIKSEWKRMAEGGPTAPEMADTVASMVGTYARQFADTTRASSTLMNARRIGRTPQDVAQRPETLRKITREEATFVSRRLFDVADLSFAIAGGAAPPTPAR